VRLRRFVALLATAGVAAVVTTIAPARTDRPGDRGVCNATGVDVYFWPQGHPAIPAIGFPAYAPTHAELYKPRDVSDAGALGYMDVGNVVLSPSLCSPVSDAAMTFAAGATPQTTTATQKVRCLFAANVDLRMGPLNKVTRRYVTRIIKVKGKRKKVRRLVRKTVRIGNVASVGVSGSAGALLELKLQTSGGSSMKWDTRSCTAIDVTG
jgi:hypothetical protein